MRSELRHIGRFIPSAHGEQIVARRVDVHTDVVDAEGLVDSLLDQLRLISGGIACATLDKRPSIKQQRIRLPFTFGIHALGFDLLNIAARERALEQDIEDLE